MAEWLRLVGCLIWIIVSRDRAPHQIFWGHLCLLTRSRINEIDFHSTLSRTSSRFSNRLENRCANYQVQHVLANWIGIRKKNGPPVEILRISSGRGVPQSCAMLVKVCIILKTLFETLWWPVGEFTQLRQCIFWCRPKYLLWLETLKNFH